MVKNRKDLFDDQRRFIYTFRMRIIFLVCTLLVFFSYPRAYPQVIDQKSCASIDMNPFFGEPRNQGNSEWCGLYTIADLLTYTFREELQGQTVSAIHLALAFSNDEPLPLVWGIDLLTQKQILKQAQETGLCVQGPEERMFIYSQQPTWLKEHIQAWLGLRNIFQRQGEESFKKQFSLFSDPLLHAIPEQTLKSIFQKDKFQAFWRSLASAMCKHIIHIPTKNQIETVFITKEKTSQQDSLLTILNQQMNQSNPVIITIPLLSFLKGSEASAHSLLVTGQRWNEKEGSCEFQIRNSWDPTQACALYSEENQKYCQKGFFWMKSEEIKKQAFSALFLEKKTSSTSLIPPSEEFTQIVAGSQGVFFLYDQTQRLFLAQFGGFEKNEQPIWMPPSEVKGFGTIKKLFTGSLPGIVYFVNSTGMLSWNRYLKDVSGQNYLQEKPLSYVLKHINLPNWNLFSQIVGGAKGKILAAHQDGSLFLFQHVGYEDGTDSWENYGFGKKIGKLPRFPCTLLGEAADILYCTTLQGKLWFRSLYSQKWRESNITFPPYSRIWLTDYETFYTHSPENGLWIYYFQPMPHKPGFFIQNHPPKQIHAGWPYS